MKKFIFSSKISRKNGIEVQKIKQFEKLFFYLKDNNNNNNNCIQFK